MTNERTTSKPTTPLQSRSPRVFIVHGRDLAARDELKLCLVSLGLDVEPFEHVADRLAAMPIISDVVRAAIEHAEVIVVLFTPDEQAALFDPITARFVDSEPAAARWQARPNVIFEAGWAFGLKPDQTVFVSVGEATTLFADVGGHHVIRLDAPGGKAQLRRRLAPLCGSHFALEDNLWASAPDTGDFARHARRRLLFHDDLGELHAKLSNMDVGTYNLLDLLVAVNERNPAWRWEYRVPRDLVQALKPMVDAKTTDDAHWWLASIGFFRFSEIDNWGDDWEESISILSFAPRSVVFLEWLRTSLSADERGACARRVAEGAKPTPPEGGPSKPRKRKP